jgi:hypothetical protein
LYKFSQKTDRASNQQPWWFANSGKLRSWKMKSHFWLSCNQVHTFHVLYEVFASFYFFCRSKLRSWKMKSQKRNHIYICYSSGWCNHWKLQKTQQLGQSCPR